MFLIVASLCLLSLSTGQQVDLTSCITKENNLRMVCTFAPDTPAPQCKYVQANRTVASTNSTDAQDPKYKNRANVTVSGGACLLTLTGLPDVTQQFTCIIRATQRAETTATVDKNALGTCSSAAILQSSAAPLLILILASFLPGPH
uniref:Uncharacterized protein n=1 Tax=Denticeps clupeoides TaxID=299321 RepID=A0A8C4A5X2_9TELE